MEDFFVAIVLGGGFQHEKRVGEYHNQGDEKVAEEFFPVLFRGFRASQGGVVRIFVSGSCTMEWDALFLFFMKMFDYFVLLKSYWVFWVLGNVFVGISI